jgi:3-oxoacyl-[acyl-carrier protein] reductase
MDLELRGCVAIVAGASSGIGLATALSLAGEGCDVALFARRGDRLAEAVDAIAALGSGAHGLVVVGDSREPADLQRALDATLERFGRLDIVVNNTGGPPAGTFEELDEDAWRNAWELTLMSTLRLSRIALPALRASGRGRIVNITSSTVKEPNEDLLLSNVYRPGVIGWAKTIARDEGPNGITVNSVAPGFIDTDRLKEIYASGDDAGHARAREERLIPVGRFGDAREVADAIAFLCSARAAYITGTTLLIDGGVARGLLS